MNPKLLIVPLINKKEHGVAIQRKKFSFGLKVTNESNNPSPEFIINNIKFYSDKNQDMVSDFRKEFNVGILNPNESKNIEIEEDGQIIHGLVRIEASIHAKEQGTIIDIVQKNQITKNASDSFPNRFVDFFYIRSLNEVKQEKSTRWMIWLTIIIGIFAFAQLAIFVMQIYNGVK